MRYGSVCSGIEAASVAWEPLNWKPAWFAEIEQFPSAVLAHRYPEVPNLGDMTLLAERIAAGEIEAPDVPPLSRQAREGRASIQGHRQFDGDHSHARHRRGHRCCRAPQTAGGRLRASAMKGMTRE
jgi:hypothetical protein